ncbi:MAG: class I SAM-dependent methyltransferase [Bacteroidales bacterium]|nr:class I SAM-dependent methyltransferase [Bacteroidales bacterium]
MNSYVAWQIKSRIVYGIKSYSRFKIHSPFVFELIEKVLKDKSKHSDFSFIEKYRKSLSRSRTVIETVDFGERSGNKQYLSTFEKLGPLVTKRTLKKAQGRALYRLNQYFKPKTILEFGTAAGISAAYLKLPVPDATMITMEGCASLADVASNTLSKLQVKNTDIRIGDFEVTLPKVLENLDTLDMVFFDGNHRFEPTVEYFNQCVEKANENSYFVFDDIHWSPGMEKAWKTIKKDPRVIVSIDLFWMGIVFFRKGMPKQDFVIRY